MELVDSHLDLTDSFLDTSQFSDSSQLLQSRLSSKDMHQMETDSLLLKLLQLYQALDNTEKENQLLRIEKTQLRTQLKNTKSKAKNFIHNNIIAAQSITYNSNHSENKYTPTRTPPQPSQNCFTTPYDSAEDLENAQSTNKVFIKSHQRRISNNCNVLDHQNMIDPKKKCYTLMNSPTKHEQIRIENPKTLVKQKSVKKITFPKNKLSALISMEREYEERNELQLQNRTLENFESFFCHKKEDFGETQRWGGYQNAKPKQLAKTNYNEQKNTYNEHKVYQPFQKQQNYNQYDQNEQYNQKEQYEQSQSDRNTQKCLNRSMSSSGLSNKGYCNSRGFKIPSSIDEIWGFSNKLEGGNNSSNSNNRTTKLSKVNANKAGLQRKTYLHY